mmetsp:Transcript_122277/g.342265  ORF Transcript_122277/g.342265 Transcript_122277/m.342265 type:complete len:186 (+) Transcript_122277:53-610(+)
MISVQTPFMKSSECDVKTMVVGYPARYSSSHTQAPRSKWFVGSSRMRSVGFLKSACAKATRMRQPPDMSLVARAIIVSVKPRPWRSAPASGSKVSGDMRSNLSPRSSRTSAFSSGSSSQSVWMRFSKRSYSFWATSMTLCNAETSVGSDSLCTNHMSTWSGIGSSLAAMHANNVVFPLPFAPMRP